MTRGPEGGCSLRARGLTCCPHRQPGCGGEMLRLQPLAGLQERRPPWFCRVSIQPSPTPLAPGTSPSVGSPKKVLCTEEQGPESGVCRGLPCLLDPQACPCFLVGGSMGHRVWGCGCPTSEPHSPSRGPGPRVPAAPGPPSASVCSEQQAQQSWHHGESLRPQGHMRRPVL